MTVAEGAKDQAERGVAPLLQWGRNLTVAEGVAGPSGIEIGEGLQWGRNLTVAEGLTSPPPPPAVGRFNGAAT